VAGPQDKDLLLSAYDYELPPELIAQVPERQRDRSRLLSLSLSDGAVSHHRFADLPDLLLPGDLLVMNDTRVVPARLLGNKDTGGRVEVLILDYAGAMERAREGQAFSCECLVKASKPPKAGQKLLFDQGLEAVVERTPADGVARLAFSLGPEMERALWKVGRTPLPPYIRRDQEAPCDDREAYQTVYATRDGAVAAPTAGLHFTPELLDRLGERGVETARVTLHVGYGTFLPVRTENLAGHRMHPEWCRVDEQAAAAVNRAKAEGRRVVAVGTTTVRALEHFAPGPGRLSPGAGMCDLFIRPGYSFKIIDALVTNFHLPRSTLLMLVSALAGRERVLAAYQEAVARGYRFYSYGDAMLLL